MRLVHEAAADGADVDWQKEGAKEPSVANAESVIHGKSIICAGDDWEHQKLAPYGKAVG